MSVALNAVAPTTAQGRAEGRKPPPAACACAATHGPDPFLRDLFAGLAMAGIWASGRRNTDGELQPAQIARIVYATADAMLKRRQSG